MRSILPILPLILATVAGCAGPIETRVETAAPQAITGPMTFRFAAADEDEAAVYGTAREAIANKLIERQFTQADTGAMLVDVGIASRPADIALTAGEKDETQTLSAAKQQKFLQSCKDVEHRLTITMSDAASGRELFVGSAAEYHCKGSLAQSLPFLVEAALANLSQPGSRSIERIGIE